MRDEPPKAKSQTEDGGRFLNRGLFLQDVLSPTTVSAACPVYGQATRSSILRKDSAGRCSGQME